MVRIPWPVSWRSLSLDCYVLLLAYPKPMRDAAVRVWFNRHFSTIGRVLYQLAQAREPLPIWTCVSHRHSHFTGYALADHALLEPAGLDATSYLDWCLHTARRLKITHLVPGHEQAYLTAHAAQFAALDCTVVKAAPAEILPKLHRKEWVYAQVADAVPLPEYEVVTEVDQALAAIARLAKDGDVSVKPTVSVYGKGFFRLVEGTPERPDADTIMGWEARVRGGEHFPPHLIMRYLPGSEYSVDLAARNGELLTGVVRCKNDENKVQIIAHKPELIAMAATMIRRFQANGLLNIQFKEDCDGIARLLEINPRASGGMGMSCLAGVNLPDIAYRAVLFPDMPIDLPIARTGIHVAEMSMAVELPLPQQCV